MKNKILKVIAISMALVLAIPINVFATPIGLANSTESVATDTLDKVNGTDYFVDEDTNVWQDGEIIEEARVTVSRTSQFEITIPKEVVLNGSTGIADYKVKAKGDIAGDQKISVVPDVDFTLSEAGGKANVTATVTQPDTEYDYVKLQGDGTEYDGNISATLTAGEWSGKFNFNIEFKTKIKTFNDYSWSEIAAISETGNAASMFSVGDEKELQIGDETYHVEIIGFNHDDKSDGTGKAGITVGLKEIMTTGHVMNSTATNVGGWRDSEMRTYLNNNILNSLPSDLQSVIKTVNKISDAGNRDPSTLITTEDKLYIFSAAEFGRSNSNIVSGQGTQYEYLTDSVLRNKRLLNGYTAKIWYRSACTTSDISFFAVSTGMMSITSNDDANSIRGVVFGFSI